MKIYTSAQIKQIENKASLSGMSFLQMMNNAGVACAKAIRKHILTDPSKKTVVVCGNGKNGGDGFVVAGYLKDKGFPVSVVLVCGEPKAEEAIAMKDRLDDADIKFIDYDKSPSLALTAVFEADIIVDAIFGFNFRGEPDTDMSMLFDVINTSHAKVVAIDLPSGVECDTAAVNGECVSADLTLAISYRKPAHVLLPASHFCGKTVTVNIGLSKDCCQDVPDAGFFTFDSEKGKFMLPERDPMSHKGDYGRVLSICGSKKYAGAAVLAASGAVKIGAGLVTAAFPDTAYPAIGAKLTEPILLPLPSSDDGFIARGANSCLHDEIKKADAVLFGCGIGQTLGSSSVLEETLNICSCPIIIDADGINLLSANIDSLEAVRGHVILTPHPGEMARLLDITVEHVQSNRIVLAKALAQKYEAIVVLKGANTVVASPDEVYVNQTGNAGMARGGSGDLLAGMMLGLIGQGIDGFHAAVAAVYIHGAVGDEAAAKLSTHGMTPSYMLEILPKLLSDFE